VSRASFVVRRASGVTLVELLVVLTVLGVILGVTGLALATLKVPRESELTLELRQTRTDAIRTGTPRTAHHAPRTLFLPDGRAIGPGADPLTGKPNAK
jgi:prepilin-type N-terminal cleavage/methylation domain-containing protein